MAIPSHESKIIPKRCTWCQNRNALPCDALCSVCRFNWERRNDYAEEETLP